MRAITLTMEAFGPYSTKQTIDFNQLGYETIFLITGPTGAGKTSIFDAMVYALYGRASGSERDQDTLRSHFAEEGQSTEVCFVFELKDKKYEVRRSPKQLKKKERGEGFTEQPPKAELYVIHETEKELIASKIKEVNETIESMLRLDYEQFRKMIMIPQGEFRRLISENSKEREEILQKIFQTYVYEHMTDRLKEESKKLKETVEHLAQKENSEIDKLHWTTEEKESVTSSTKALEKLEDELKTDDNYLKELMQSLSDKRQQLKKKQEEYYSQKQLKQQFHEYEQYKQELETMKQQEPTISNQEWIIHQAEKANLVKSYEEQALRRKEESKKQETRLLQKQQDYEVLQKEFSNVEEQYKEEEGKTEEREELRQSIEKYKQELEQLREYTDLKKQATALLTSKQQQEEKVNKLQMDRKEFQQKVHELSKSNYEYQYVNKRYYELESKERELDSIINQVIKLMNEEEKLQQMRQHYQQVQRQYESVKKQREAAIQEVKRLEEEQKQHQAVLMANELVEGQECPVCGSTDHPNKAFTSNHYVSDDAVEKAKQTLEQVEKTLQKQQDDYVRAKSEGQSQRHIVDQQQEALQSHLTTPFLQEASRQEQKQTWEKERNETKEQKQLTAKQLSQLEEDIKHVQVYQEKMQSLDEKIEEEKSKLQETHNQWVSINTKMEHIQSGLTGEYIEDPEKLASFVTQEEERYEKWIHHMQQLSEQYQRKKEQIQKLEVEINQQQTYVEETKENEKKADEQLVAQCNEVGFESVEAYQLAKLDQEELRNKKEEVNQFRKKQQSTQDSYTKLYEQLHDKEVPNLEDMESLLTEMENNLEELSEQYQQIYLKKTEHARIYGQLEELIQLRVESEEKYYYIGELAQLARGDNAYKLSFERYVLSAFLDEIIIQANIRLDQMTEHRYQLERSQERAKGGAQSGLDLEVLDHYTGLRRSVKTLSGGEGFKAALSLALGMADVVQAHAGGVQLDTLFIDEGFGTLDEESLDQAINCLKDLQKGNRMLGIISHVPKLKQEIPAKLQISPSPKGSTCAFSLA
ncbi:AAA family ATPase [Pontibacillus yanchengensis]|uniref:AAA family ATPase n=1 Tax=Pontibacillus yanchengensis TaxID=462910 RepID=A0ACC7VAX1_9BACI|nr:SbcC/MukB-like Walker B domain-containing protein [Pontibacillus yanchengensis]MYL51740.1 AAA family ATPase [Pontibacillus yanchengensis]